MDEIENKSFFRSHKALSILPLLLLSLGGLYYVFKHKPDDTSGKTPADFNFGKPAPKAAAAPSPAALAAEEAKNIGALDIQGAPVFKSQVTRALKLIWLSDRETFLFIKRYVFVIRNEDRTGFYMDSGQPVAAISVAHAFRSLPWCAGIIAHQAYHSYITFSLKKRTRGAPPPPGAELKAASTARNLFNYEFTSLDSLVALEAKASRFQAATLENVGASRAELKEVTQRKPQDYKPGHDGQYDLLVKP